MALYLVPHTQEWFEALDEFDPAQAVATRQVLKLVGRSDVCGSCGDVDAIDYRITPKDRTVHPASTMRLCQTCRDLRSAVLKETSTPLGEVS